MDIAITDADRLAGLLAANATLTQRVVDLEIINAALRRVITAMEAKSKEA